MSIRTVTSCRRRFWHLWYLTICLWLETESRVYTGSVWQGRSCSIISTSLLDTSKRPITLYNRIWWCRLRFTTSIYICSRWFPIITWDLNTRTSCRTCWWWCCITWCFIIMCYRLSTYRTTLICPCRTTIYCWISIRTAPCKVICICRYVWWSSHWTLLFICWWCIMYRSSIWCSTCGILFTFTTWIFMISTLTCIYTISISCTTS